MWRKIRRNKITFLYEEFLFFVDEETRKKIDKFYYPIVSSFIFFSTSNINRIFYDSKSKITI